MAPTSFFAMGALHWASADSAPRPARFLVRVTTASGGTATYPVGTGISCETEDLGFVALVALTLLVPRRRRFGGSEPRSGPTV